MSQLPKNINRRNPLYLSIAAGLAATGLALAGCDSSIKPVEAAKEIAAACNPCNPCAAKICNPCNPCNPCAAKACNPCNPCAAKACNPCNPCAAKACNPCNPCAAKACNPCNPCAAKACNPCNPCNPCAAKKACNPCNPCNPCAAKNPCNPCAANACNPCNPCNPCSAVAIRASDFIRPSSAIFDLSVATSMAGKGEQLWNDTSLSTNGLACASCHTGGALLNATFAEPYPHAVAMPTQRAGVGAIDIDEMVNFCMLAPMQASALPWDSDELAALSGYALEIQADFNPCAAKAAGNPCNPCNPCAAKACNPCNPCAAKACNPCNPCAAKACNPCNPCAAKACNPCNPCAAKACNPCNPCNPCAAKITE